MNRKQRRIEAKKNKESANAPTIDGLPTHTKYLLNIIGVLVERLGNEVRLTEEEIQQHRDLGWVRETPDRLLFTSFPQNEHAPALPVEEKKK